MHPLERRGSLAGVREFVTGDAVAAQAWTGDERAIQFVPLGPLDADGNRSYVRTLTKEAKKRPRTTYTMAIYDIDDAARMALGAVAISVDSREHRRAELGFMLRPSHWGRGLASDAVGLMVDFAFEDLAVHRVWAVCDPENVASQALLRRAGFECEGRLRGDLLIRGERRDSLLYGRLVSDCPSAYL